MSVHPNFVSQKKQSGHCSNEKGLTITEKVKYILYDLTRFNKTLDDIIAQAIKRLLVKTASEKLLKEQAKNMVMTEEELDYLASLRVRARAEGRSEGKNEGHADAISVLQDMGFPPEKIAEAKARLDALNSSK